MNKSLSVNYLSQHSSQKKKSEHTAATKEGNIVRKIEVVGGGWRKKSNQSQSRVLPYNLMCIQLTLLPEEDQC